MRIGESVDTIPQREQRSIDVGAFAHSIPAVGRQHRGALTSGQVDQRHLSANHVFGKATRFLTSSQENLREKNVSNISNEDIQKS